MVPTIVSFYTRNTLYEKDAEALKASCEKWGLKHQIVGVDPFGKWHSHTCYKPIFLLEMMRRLKEPILWLDADAEVVQRPLLFDGMEADIGLRVMDWYPKEHPCHYYAGTVFLNQTPGAYAIAEKWAERCQDVLDRGLESIDQQVLVEIMDQVAPKIGRLPRGYAAIFQEEMPIEEKFIVQYQASRLYRKIIDEEVSLGFLDQLSIDQIRTYTPRL